MYVGHCFLLLFVWIWWRLKVPPFWGKPSHAQLIAFDHNHMLHFDNHWSVYKYYGWPSLAQLVAFTHVLCFNNCRSLYINIFPRNGAEIKEVKSWKLMNYFVEVQLHLQADYSSTFDLDLMYLKLKSIVLHTLVKWLDILTAPKGRK